MKLISDYSWYWALLCFAAGLLYAFLLYFRDKKNADRSRSLLYTLFGLRCLAVTAIALMLMNLYFRHLVNETEKPLIVIAQDNSSSLLAGKDSAEFRKNYLTQLNEFTERVSEKFDVRSYGFDDQVEQRDNFDFKGKETDISAVFRMMGNNYANRNIGALIIASDGIYNKGTQPVYAASKLKYPVYTIALGDTTPIHDLWIQKINHNQVAYLGNRFPVEVVINATRLKNKTATLSLYGGNGSKITQAITIPSDNYSNTFNFILDADKPGIQKYTVTVSYVDGEQNKQNNVQSFVIDVIDNREKILILAAAPHPDIAAIKGALEANQNYEVEIGLAGEFNTPLKPYSLIILDQIQLNAPANARLLNELANNNQPYFLITTASTDNLPGLKIQGGYSKMNDAEAMLDKSFSLFTLSDELKSYIKEFPAVKTPLGTYVVTNNSNALINQRIGVVDTENPLLLFTENSGRKMGLFLGDGLWRWRLRDYADHGSPMLFNELISKITQYLSVKADKSFFRVFTKKIVTENEALDFSAEVYNQSYELITEPEVSLQLKNEKGSLYKYTFSKASNSYRLSAGLFPPGEYSYAATVKVQDKVFEQKGLITVKEIVAERINTVADHALLFQLAHTTGGKMYSPAQFAELEKELLDNPNIKSITYTEKQLTDLIDWKWLFFIILALLGTEWFLRKRNGNV